MAASDTAPALPTLTVDVAKRGQVSEIHGRHLDPGTEYVVSSDVFDFRVGSGTPKSSVTVRSDAAGRLFTAGLTHYDLPLTTTRAHVRVRDAAGALVVRTTVRVQRPSLSLLQSCPGVGTRPEPVSFAAGRYTLRSRHVVFDPPAVTVDANGDHTHVQATIDAGYHRARVRLTIVPRGQGVPAVHRSVRLDDPLLYPPGGDTAGQAIDGDCFNAGEQVSVTPASLNVRGTTSAGPRGHVDFVIHPHADATRHRVRVRVTSPGGRSASERISVAGTTLRSGRTLGLTGAKGQVLQLRSPRYDYRVGVGFGTCAIGVRHVHVYPDGGATVRPVWLAGHRNGQGYGFCHAVLRRNGNLELLSPRKGLVWQTHTAGSGRHDRLVLRESGSLQLVTGDGRVVWHSPADA